MTTYADLCSGGSGATRGALDAGLTPLWGIENVDEIAQVSSDNGFHVVTADATTVDPAGYERPGVLHASLPCPNFSPAKMGGKETAEDIALALATVRFIEALEPRVFTLENVWRYRRSESWRLIQDALNRTGYWTDVHHLNSADFGVPQTRKRMIVRAARPGWLPPLPAPVPWVGWYQAIEDLLPGLSDSAFAPWQLKRGVQDMLDQACLFAQGSYDHTDAGNERNAQPIGRRTATEPAFTVSANSNMQGMRAFLAIPGRVVKMSPRCLARFQSVPDDYVLPENDALAVRVIGNMVPPLMMQRLLEPFA